MEARRRNLLTCSPARTLKVVETWRRRDVAESCGNRMASPYLKCAPEQQKEILDLIAYRRQKDSAQVVDFFAFLRKNADGFFTSQIGIKYLGYVGNTFLLA